MALSLAVLIWIDYRHEVTAIMGAHMMHEAPVGSSVAPNPVPIHTDPVAVARWTFWIHVFRAGTVLVMVAALVNIVPQRLVVGLLSELESGMVRMIRGDWRPQTGPSGADEIDRVRIAFRDMGPLLEAVVRQALQAERLATLAAVSKHVETRTSGPIETLAQTAAGLIASPDAGIKAAGAEISRSTASVVAVVRSLDAIFERGGMTWGTRMVERPGGTILLGHRPTTDWPNESFTASAPGGRRSA